ncbi:MAG: hypothetical protein WAQ75_06680, partial [Propionicimonas sp.]
MLDEETPTPTDETTAQPPRRRRAASRPAGPPKALEPTAAAPSVESAPSESVDPVVQADETPRDEVGAAVEPSAEAPKT